jgi:hypothetical protein
MISNFRLKGMTMTDRKDALTELLAKVKAACLDEVYCLTQHVNGIGMNASMWQAYNGSLDAAKELHEAVLPDWRITLWRGGKVQPVYECPKFKDNDKGDD